MRNVACRRLSKKAECVLLLLFFLTFSLHAQESPSAAPDGEKKAVPGKTEAVPDEENSPAGEEADPAKDGKEEENKEEEKEEDAYAAAMDFVRAMTILRNTYVDKEKTSYDELFRAAIKGMLQELDPFSSYEQARRFKELTDEHAGQFAGIGTTLTMRNRFLEIIFVVPDSPSAHAGLKSGDIIVEIDGVPTTSMNMDQAVNTIRGELGAELKLKIYRPSEDKSRDVVLKRALISNSTVTGAHMLEDGIGYLRINQFSASTAEDLDKALEKLKKENMKALIVDVRGNPGGLLDSGVEVCSRFIKTGSPVVSIEGRGESKTRHTAIDCGKILDIPLAVLVNGNSASAAEIFAACMQDHKRAILIGAKTFGKGSVQSIIPFEEDSVLRITTAKYYTPSRRVIHGNGVAPDISVVLSPAHDAALANQISLFPGEVKPLIPNPVRDLQLERALEILKSVMIFREANSSQP